MTGVLTRDDLKAAADAYVAAMVVHDPRGAPLAPDALIVENLARIQPTEGLWTAASAGPTSFQIHVPDVAAQEIGYMAVMEADGKPVQIGLRLKFERGQITEAEQLVVYALRETGMPNLKTPRAAFSQPVIEPFRDARGRLLQIARNYYDALELNNGRLAPIADDCVRHENGIQTCRNSVPDDWTAATFGVFGSLSAAAQLDSQVFGYISRIDNRHVFAVDEECGLAVGFSHFVHDMQTKDIRVFGVPGVETWNLDFAPFDLPAMHIYKIWGGELHEIEALGYIAPYRSVAYRES
jgi:hypothetical protein